MDLWQELIKGLGSFSVIVIALTYLIKQLIPHLFSRDLEKFKADLGRESLKHRVRYEKMHNQRAEAIKNTYSKLVKTHRAFGHFMSPLQLAGDLPEEEKAKIAAESANDFTQYYEQNKIFFSKDLTQKIDNISGLFKSAWINFETCRWQKDFNDLKMKYWDSAWKIIDKDVPIVIEEVEDEFRKVIGLE